MSWAIAGDWLAVAGLSSVTFGTAAQAVGNLAEFKDLRARASLAALTALAEGPGVKVLLPIGPPGFNIPVALPPMPKRWRRLRRLRSKLWRAMSKMGAVISYPSTYPGSLKQLREGGGEDAVKLAQYLRAAIVWAILTAGAALVAVSAVIQLALAYSALRRPVQLDLAHQFQRPGTRQDHDGALVARRIHLRPAARAATLMSSVRAFAASGRPGYAHVTLARRVLKCHQEGLHCHRPRPGGGTR